ncbi:hypothetical protein HMPREF1574_01421, partial [Gardnerella pickettii JCP7659]
EFVSFSPHLFTKSTKKGTNPGIARLIVDAQNARFAFSCRPLKLVRV